MRLFIFAIMVFLFFACNRSYDPLGHFTQDQYDTLLLKLAPYVIKKPDEFSFEDRFNSKASPFYKRYIDLTNSEITFYQPDTVEFFFFCYRDLTSLYEHYRGLGGYFKTNEKGKIVYLNLLYHTPRFTEKEMEEKGKVLFGHMIKTGNVEDYIGNRTYIHTPNADFYYDTMRNRWDYTINSSWKFLEEAKQKADNTNELN